MSTDEKMGKLANCILNRYFDTVDRATAIESKLKLDPTNEALHEELGRLKTIQETLDWVKIALSRINTGLKVEETRYDPLRIV